MPDERPHHTPHDTVESTDTLIGRIIDREASAQELESFEQLATGPGGLWRTLALRHLDMAVLSDRVLERTDVVDRVEAVPRARRLSLPLMMSGWAAVIVLGLWWAVLSVPQGPDTRPTVGPVLEPPAVVLEMTPEDHLAEYLRAPYVLGELDPILLETEPLPEGRHRLRIIRRIEEHIEIGTPPDALIGDNGRLTLPPRKLKADS